MALMFTDSSRLVQDFLVGASVDIQAGEENDLQLSMAIEDYNKVSAGSLVFDREFPQFGGRLDKVSINTANESLTWHGKTFRGMLSEKIIPPPTGEAYRRISGSFGHVINVLLELTNLDNVFYTDLPDSDRGDLYTIDRYVTLLDALDKIADALDYSLKVLYNINDDDNRILITTQERREVVQGEEFNSDQFSFEIEKDYRKVNALYCLGSGSLTSRMVILLYADDTGTIDIVEQFPSDAVEAVYDYSNVESREELIKGGIERLKELRNTENIDISPPEDKILDVGDVISAKDSFTGIVATKQVTKVIYTSDGESRNIRYETN